MEEQMQHRKNENTFALTFYFFLTHYATTEKNKRKAQAISQASAGSVKTSNSGAMNVHHLKQTLSESQTLLLRPNRKAAP